ncbi:MAG: hypothetical protein OXC91_00950 [Rhodobacteraceae bacterium]|nr:hypothetical protein [Paracoccaceae bacterium]
MTQSGTRKPICLPEPCGSRLIDAFETLFNASTLETPGDAPDPFIFRVRHQPGTVLLGPSCGKWQRTHPLHHHHALFNEPDASIPAAISRCFGSPS